MKASDRIITVMPLAELWNESGPVPGRRGEALDREQIRSLLRHGPVQFVVAIGGFRPSWIEHSRTFDFWKQEVQPHLNESDRPYLEDYPGEYFYFASEWHLESGERVVLLEQVH